MPPQRTHPSRALDLTSPFTVAYLYGGAEGGGLVDAGDAGQPLLELRHFFQHAAVPSRPVGAGGVAGHLLGEVGPFVELRLHCFGGIDLRRNGNQRRL